MPLRQGYGSQGLRVAGYALCSMLWMPLAFVPTASLHAVDFPTAGAADTARAGVPTPMYQQPGFLDQSGAIQNVQSYSSNPFWNPTGPYNQRMPMPIYAQGSDLSAADCNAMVSYLVAAECGRRNNCSGLRVMDIKPAVVMALDAQSGQHSYITACSGYIDSAFATYMANSQNVAATGFPAAFPSAGGMPAAAATDGRQLVLPTVTANDYLYQPLVAAAAAQAGRAQQLANLQAQNDDGTPLLTAQKYPKIFADLSFADQQAVLKEGYEPWREKTKTLEDGSVVCIENCPYQSLKIESNLAMYTRKANEATARAEYLQAVHDSDFCGWCKQVPQNCLAEQNATLEKAKKAAIDEACAKWADRKSPAPAIIGW
ncbi:MAG: hypothetical protein FWC51_04875, partial [Proteobacteria bacterium]|nr:hypothetical protein [Pseudomonadota bacterium]